MLWVEVSMRTALTLLLLCCLAWAQEETKPPELHKIYVPYEKLDEVLGTDKERVMVPYKQFMELWEHKYGPRPGAEKPPVPFAVESATYEGRVKEGIAYFSVKMEIEVFDSSWQSIPLAFSGVAFDEVMVDGSPGVILPTRKGYQLILRGKGRHKMEARIVAGVERGKEFATTSFGLPATPLHRLGFRVPGKGTEVKIEPARAFTTRTEGDQTILLAFLGPQGNVKLTWRYQPEETEKEPPLLFATDLYDIKVEERVLRGSAQLDLEILRSPATEFVVRVPEKVQVLEVQGANIKTWGFRDKERKELRIALHKEVSGRYSLKVGFEGPVTVPGSLTAPVFRVVGAARERGFLRVSSAEGVGLRPVSTENVFQVDLNALPKQIRGGARALGFRFPALPFALSLRTERIAPLVTLTTRARLEVDRHTVKLDELFSFLVERAGIFEVRLLIPEGIVLTQIGDPKLVDSWRESTEGGQRLLTLSLRGRRLGRFNLPIRAVAPLDLAGGKLSVPLLKVREVDREEGTLGVFMHQGLKATAENTAGVVPLEPAKFRREDRFGSQLPLAFAWRWRGGDAAVDFGIEARKPKVTSDVRYTLQAEEARVSVRVDLVYVVQYSGVETFRFQVPKRIAERLKVDARNLREKSHTDDPVEEGSEPTVTWTVILQSPSLGEVKIQAEYDEIFPAALQVNESRTVRIPAFVPVEVERTHAHAAVRKSPVIKVTADSEDYEQIDAAELPASLRSDDVFLALRRFEPPEEFLLGLTKHEYQPVADLVVRHAHLKTVVIDETKASTIAFFEILNNDRQFLAVRLPKGSKVQELQVAGKPEKPRLAEGTLLVRLKTGLRKDATFLVALAYTHPIETTGAVGSATTIRGPVLPAFEEAPEPFQALLTWSVHYPEAWQVTGFGGNVEPDEDGALHGSWLQRAIAALGGLIQPVPPPRRTPDRQIMPLGSFKDIVPTYTQRESVMTVFSNGTGNGEVVISHIDFKVKVVFILIALAVGAAAVIGLARAIKPFHAGCAIAMVALLFLAVAGPAWVPIWNGILLAALVATAVLMVLEVRRMRA
jgi:hypothetical protein